MSAKQMKRKRIRNMLPTIAIAIVTFIVMLAVFIMGVTPDQYDIQRGQPSSKTIYATKDVEDTVTTESLRTAAANAIEPTYKSVDTSVDAVVLADLRSCFKTLTSLRSDYIGATVDDATLAEFNSKAPFEFTPEMLTALIEADEDTLTGLGETCARSIQDALAAYLPEGQEEATIARITRGLISEGFPPELIEICTDAMSKCVRANMLIDTETTEANRQKARDAIEPVMLVNREVIVREGEIVTEADYQMISSLGLLADESMDFVLFGGLALVALLFCVLFAIYLMMFETGILQDYRKVLLLSIIMISQMLLCLLVRSFNAYLMPISMASIVLCVLFNRRLAIFAGILMSFISAMLVPSDSLFSTLMFATLIMGLTAGPVSALVFSKRQLRSDTLLAGVIIGIANFVTTMAVGMINSANLNTTMINALWSIGGGSFSAVLAIGLQAILELIFNLPTNAKLIELSNPNQPLLRKLLMEAPGTYHHSIIVANLAEAATSAVGGNGLLARVGAYYHDIGKLKRPLYYKENQLADNPHDRTDPRVSAAILTAHTRDGAQMAIKERLPEQIVNIIRQHHGDTLTMFFYSKAVEQFGEDVDQSAFRYEGPRPQSIEAAVVMLADTIEAATRSMKDPTPESMEALIRKLISAKMTDGQLDNSPLTFDDIDKICATFVTVLTGVFHQRIEYPEMNIPPRVHEHVEPAPEPVAEPSASPEEKSEAE